MKGEKKKQLIKRSFEYQIWIKTRSGRYCEDFYFTAGCGFHRLTDGEDA